MLWGNIYFLFVDRKMDKDKYRALLLETWVEATEDVNVLVVVLLPAEIEHKQKSLALELTKHDCTSVEESLFKEELHHGQLKRKNKNL